MGSPARITAASITGHIVTPAFKAGPTSRYRNGRDSVTDNASNIILPVGVVLRHRVTKRDVAPPTAIYAQDWPIYPAAPHTRVWRYMKWKWFEKLISDSALSFIRADQYKDRFEGYLFSGNATGPSRTDKELNEKNNIRFDYEEAKRRCTEDRLFSFISCWHIAENESQRMWDEYAPAPDSVAVITRVGLLTESMPDMIAGCVSYTPQDFARTELFEQAHYFFKPKDYEFENEYRLLRPRRAETIGETEYTKEVPINLGNVALQVVVHPKGTPDTVSRVNDLLQKAGLSITCQISGLANAAAR